MKHLETMRQIARTQRRRAEAAEARVTELKEMLNEVMPWVSSPKMQDRITEILNR